MKFRTDDNQEIKKLVEIILLDYDKDRLIDKLDIFTLPNRKAVETITDNLFGIIYPGYFREGSPETTTKENVLSASGVLVNEAICKLQVQISIALRFRPDICPIVSEDGTEKMSDCPPGVEKKCEITAREITLSFFKKIPEIREKLAMDLDAFFDGDPAAKNKSEIICSYPGLRAVTVYRLAHELELCGVPILPRIMTEYAHAQTGIDIHPGARIGNYFFIDHGTGVVIGETTVIGDHVKIYQGVTLGGLSTRGGQRLRGTKRHPTIEDNVTIYSGASILGGNTVIGHDCVIGGNAFITKSVAPNTKVNVRSQEMSFDNNSGKIVGKDVAEDAAWFYVI